MKKYKRKTLETVYTYKEWLYEYKRREKTKKAKKKEKLIYNTIQRAAGFLMIIIGLIISYLMDGDSTALIILVPFGLYMMFVNDIFVL